MSETDASTPADNEQTSSPVVETRSGGPSWWLLIALLIVVGGAYGASYLVSSWRQSAERNSIGRHEQPPTGWNGIAFGTTRGDIAKIFVDAGVRWPSIQKPGMAPTEWASHVDLELPGQPPGTFSLRFADGQRWDYGRHPASSDEIVDAEALIGGFEPQQELVGIKWMIKKSDDDEAQETVPLVVLRGLGQPHSDRQDVTGIGRVYEWDWPSLKAFYTTVDGLLSLQVQPPTGDK